MGKRTRFSSEPFGTAIERLMTEAGTTYRGLASLTSEYEAVWMPVLQALSAQRRLRCDVKLARLLIFGALNWSVQWFSARKGVSLDALSDAALDLFIAPARKDTP